MLSCLYRGLNMISIRNITVTIILGATSAWNTGCTVGLGIVDKSVDTAGGTFLDTGVADTGMPVDTDDTENTDANDTGNADTEDTQDTQDTQPTSDVDGDGFAVEDGDCDDYDPLISPSANDECDGVDNNCDGQVDENAIGGIYEPNDTPWNGYYIGDYTAGDYTEVQGLITSPTDVDIYEFFIEDGWFDDFAIEFELHAMGIQADFAIELWLIENYSGQTEQLLMTTNNLTSGGLERGDFQGDWLIDDSGYYEFRIYTISGDGCDAHYRLDIWASP